MSAAPQDAVTLPVPLLETAAAAVLEALGVPAEDARTTAEVFVGADVAGEPSHGLRLLLTVCRRLEAGGHRAATKVDVVRDAGAIAVWTAHRSLGQVVAARAMDVAVAKAQALGLGAVAVRDASSLTSAKHYALRAADAGCIGLVFTNASRKVMPPPGGTTPVMGNNPIAAAAPAGRFGAVCLDMAMTAAAIERINMAAESGTPLPPDWALGPDGQPTTDAALAAQVMTLLPFGGYKAFGLGLLTEILTSALAGGEVFAGESRGFFPVEAPMNTSFTLVALNVAAFTEPEAFAARVEAMIETMKRAAPASPGGTIRFPGERSQALALQRRREGVPIAAKTLAAFAALAERLGVAGLPARP